MAAPEDNVRQCIVTRELLPKQQLIRFVLGPGATITPDLACKLPGRGMWVKADLASVAEAVARQAFRKAAKRQVSVPEGMAVKIEQLLAKRALDALALARKSGAVITGYEKVRSALDSGKVACLLHANDAAEDGKRALDAKAENIPVFGCFSREQLGRVMARENATHVALAHGGATLFFIDQARRFAGFS